MVYTIVCLFCTIFFIMKNTFLRESKIIVLRNLTEKSKTTEIDRQK